MTFLQADKIAIHRVFVALLGGAAGAALWALADNWSKPFLPPGIYLALFVFVIVYALTVLALAGAAGPVRAISGALLLAVPVTLLASMAGARFDLATDLLDNEIMLTALLVLVLFAAPFLSVWLLDRRNWLRYDALFDTAWTTVVRYTVAWLFVGVFWLVVFLSNALLDLVDVAIIDLILRNDLAIFTLTGAVLGLAMAVVYELRQMISPYLILRLLRLMVPPVLVVLVVFLAAIPLRGLSGVFGDFSSAATLMAAAIVGISLVTTALDRDNGSAVNTGGIRMATQGLALVLPFLTALAVWSVAIRVLQYGWTPDRVLAGIISGFLLVYGLGYAGAVLLRSDWMGRIRQINVAMALAVIVMSALWMTPVLNAYWIAVNSQMALFAQGRISVDQLPLWEMQHAWGKRGQAAVRDLETLTDHADIAELTTRIAAVRSQPTRYRADREVKASLTPGRSNMLADLLPTRPEEQALASNAFDDLPLFRITQWLEGCRQTLPTGQAGCVVIWGEFTPGINPGDQAMVLYLNDIGQTQAQFIFLRDGVIVDVRNAYDPVGDIWPSLSSELITMALDGQFQILPRPGSALHIGDQVLTPAN